MSKGDLRPGWTERGIAWEEPWLRARWLEEMDRYREKKPRVERVAAAQGHKGLLLPVQHPELTPMEFVGAPVQHYGGTLWSKAPVLKNNVSIWKSRSGGIVRLRPGRKCTSMCSL